MGAWVKLFKDGSSEHGSDLDIKEGKASWSRGLLDNIVSVHLSDKMYCCALNVPNTEWYQYDRYMATLGAVGNNMSSRTARVIQAKVQPEHVGKKICLTIFPYTTIATFCNDILKDGILISQEHVGLWVTMYILTNNKIGITMSKKGAFHGDEQVLKQHS